MTRIMIVGLFTLTSINTPLVAENNYSRLLQQHTALFTKKSPLFAHKKIETTTPRISLADQFIANATTRYPHIAKLMSEQGNSLPTFINELMHLAQAESLLHMSWGIALDKNEYIAYLLTHLDTIAGQHNSIEPIIHTTNGVSGLMAQYLLSNALIKLGYKNVTCNIISNTIGHHEVSAFRTSIQEELDADQRFLLKHYHDEATFIRNVAARYAQKCHSYQINSPSHHTTSFTQAVADNNPALLEQINELVCSTPNNQTITVQFHYSQEPTIVSTSPASQELKKKLMILLASTTIKPDKKNNSEHKHISINNESAAARSLLALCNKENIPTLLVANHARAHEERHHALVSKTAKSPQPLVYVLHSNGYSKQDSVYR